MLADPLHTHITSSFTNHFRSSWRMYNSILFTFMKLYCFVPNSNPYKCFISYLVELNTSITLSCFIFIVGRSTAQWPSSIQGSQCQWGGERHEPIIISVEWNSQQSTVPRLCAGICCFIGEPDTQVILKCGQL